MDKIKEIADKADMIVNGYAFTRENNQIRILNLNNLEKALVISEDGKALTEKNSKKREIGMWSEKRLQDVDKIGVLLRFKNQFHYYHVCLCKDTDFVF
ncbi:DUF7723 family protein [Anaerobutyricum soehngenii]|uniref:DUF7723 family protein n=1 Tax=Anaerobutyricum soehngenii TaxID=105843 RepID=UPI001C0F4108|nr:hypothetical protein [Anaerobutyricum soehngenii]MBU5417807.1 hypothetical protein [Anaerobutyricum soehngenii]